MEPEPIPPGANLTEARDRLKRAIRDEIEGAAPSTRRPRERPWIFRLAGSTLRPTWRPALGVVGIAAVLVLVVRLVVMPAGRGDEAPVLRDRPATQANGPVILEPVHEADGSVTLRWSPCAGADAYEVILYGTDLMEKARFHAGPETRLHLSRDRLAALHDAPFCVVSALDRGDEIGRSDPRTLDLH
jgi:hypothetical protein